VERPVVFGAIDDHDYGQNNGDSTYVHRRESNVAFVDFLHYSGSSVVVEDDADDNDRRRFRRECASSGEGGGPTRDDDECEVGADGMDDRGGSSSPKTHPGRRRTGGRRKSADPMYHRALEGKGVYGVQLFDFSRRRRRRSGDTGDDAHPPPSSSQSGGTTKEEEDGYRVLWGGGYWVPEEEAMIDPDVVRVGGGEYAGDDVPSPNYSTTHSVAIFTLDVRSNKTPWPKGRRRRDVPTSSSDDEGGAPPAAAAATDDAMPEFDFLGRDQWEWLRSALANSRAAVNIVVSGLQVHPERFPMADGNVVEEWSKFPEARGMLYDAILNSGARGPMIVSGDVHMAQILRKDCLRSSDVVALASLAAGDDGDGSEGRHQPRTRPLVEITTSGMTHSWGTSFSSQLTNHRLPLKPYAYLVSWTFMTICHLVCPWYDIVVRDDSGEPGGGGEGSAGLQYELGLNFAEFEFDFGDDDDDGEDDDPQRRRRDGGGDGGDGGDGGALAVRVFGPGVDGPPKLAMRYTFDELTGTAAVLPGTTARMPKDFLVVLRRGEDPMSNNNVHAQRESSPSRTAMMTGDEEGWTCVPHRGLAPAYREHAANVVIFFAFCFLFFLPHATVVLILVVARRRWLSRGR